MTEDELRLRVAIDALLAEFCWRIDRNKGVGVGDLFTPDGRLTVPGKPGEPDQVFEGRAAIAARWAGRPATVVTRHIYTNLRVLQQSDSRAEAQSVGIGIRHEGAGLGATVPLVITDFDDRLERDADGVWHFAERRITLVFADPSFGA